MRVGQGETEGRQVQGPKKTRKAVLDEASEQNRVPNTATNIVLLPQVVEDKLAESGV